MLGILSGHLCCFVEFMVGQTSGALVGEDARDDNGLDISLV